VVPCDISFTALALARQHYQVESGAACNVEMLPFKSASFDAIWFGETLALLENVHAALAEFNRVLKPGGWIAITTPYYGLAKNLYIALFCFDRHYYPEDYRIRHFSKPSLVRLLEHNGFAVRQWAGIGRFKGFWKSQYLLAVKSRAPKERPNWHRDMSSSNNDYADSPLNATEYFQNGQSNTR
jgi:ubiquinone/menaquinone biosynthesis C-methylase UbiE